MRTQFLTIQRNYSQAITIEDNVWIGDRVIILGGVTIGEGAIIQAGLLSLTIFLNMELLGAIQQRCSKKEMLSNMKT